MKTLDGEDMTVAAATHPIGTALRIAPGFTASTRDDAGIEVTLDVHYDADEGRYRVLTAVISTATRSEADVSPQTLRQIAIPAIVQAAAAQAVAVTFDDPDDPAARWRTVAELAGAQGRILPDWLAEKAAQGGNTELRMDIIAILYGVSALAGNPPVKTVQVELDVPHRTAADWIARARRAGRLAGVNYSVGRQADG